MPYMLDRLTTHQAHAILEPTNDDGDWNSSRLHDRQPLTVEQIARFPKKMRFDVPLRSLKEADFIAFTGGEHLVSSRVLRHLEELEPQVHQVLPFTPTNPPRIVQEAGLTFGLVNCCNREDFIDIERSQLLASELPGSIVYVPGGAPIYAKPGWRPSRHLWMSLYPRGLSDEICFRSVSRPADGSRR